MGMFDSFLGQGDGYTTAQRTGLQRSAEIKKRRKEEERAFESKKIKAESRRAITERSIMEAGETRRTAMGEAGATERQRMYDVGMMARQRLTGERGVEAATVKARREAETLSVKRGHELSLAEIKAKKSKPMLFETISDEPGVFYPGTGKTERLTLPPITTPGETARNSLGGVGGGSPWDEFDDPDKRGF